MVLVRLLSGGLPSQMGANREKKDPDCSVYIIIYMRTALKVGKTNEYSALPVCTVLIAYMRTLLSFDQCKSPKSSQLLDAGPLKVQQ